MKICEKWQLFKEKLENRGFSADEIILAGICLFLFGILLGIIFSPKKMITIGSNNGNNNSDCNGIGSVPDDEDFEDEDDYLDE